jgi:hydroxyacylglutathione hydrolase
MLSVDIIPCLNDNYSYLLHCRKTNTVLIIDPSEFDKCDQLIQKKYRKLDYILNTHHHFDHVGGNKMLKQKYNSKVLGYEKDKDRIPGINVSLKDKEIFNLGSISFEVIFIPGHTSGHIAFYLKNKGLVFTGDTLFSLGCGKIFEGNPEQMFASLNKLKDLPPKTKLYCGHEYTKKNLDFCLKYDLDNVFLKEKKEWLKFNTISIPTTIEDELKTNIFLRCDEQTIKDALNLENASDQEIFIKLRGLKDDF